MEVSFSSTLPSQTSKIRIVSQAVHTFMTVASETLSSYIAIVQWLPKASWGCRGVITGIILYCHSLSTLLWGGEVPQSATTGAILQGGWQGGEHGREKGGFCERPRGRRKRVEMD